MPQLLRRSSPWLNRSGAEGDLKELNGRTPAKLTRYGTRARSTHACRRHLRPHHDRRVMLRLCGPPETSGEPPQKSHKYASRTRPHRYPTFQEVYHPVSAYLEKAPTAQLTRINAADRLFSVPLTRITSVPECAVSSVGFLWGSGTVSRRCGVSVGSPRPLAGSADRRGVPRYRGFRTPMTTFLVTQRHRCHLPACDNSAPNDAPMFVKASFSFRFSAARPGNFAGVLGADKTGMIHSGWRESSY